MTDGLKEIGKKLREEEAAGARLDELGQAALSGKDTAELERELQVDAEAARIAYQPLSAELKARIGAEISRSLGPHPERSASPPPAPSRIKYGLWSFGLALAAAAVVALELNVPVGSDELELASYELQVENAVSRERSAPSASAAEAPPLLLEPGSVLRLVLQPARATDAPVAARAYLLHGNKLEELLRSSLETTQVGALRLTSQLPATLPKSGTLVVVLSHSALGDQVPIPVIAMGSTPAGAGWQRLERRFESVQ